MTEEYSIYKLDGIHQVFCGKIVARHNYEALRKYKTSSIGRELACDYVRGFFSWGLYVYVSRNWYVAIVDSAKFNDKLSREDAIAHFLCRQYESLYSLR